MSSFQATPAFPFARPELARSWMDLKLPSLTLAAMIEAQHKNAAALGSANQAAFDGLRTLLQRQGFLMTASVDTCTRVTGDLLAARSFEEGATRQVDAARDAYTSIVARIRELSDIMIEANVTAMGIVNARVIEAFGEMKALFAPPPAAAPATGEAPVPAIAESAAAVEEVAAAVEKAAAVETANVPAEPNPVTAPAASSIASEAEAPEAEAVAAPTPSPTVAREPDVDAAPTPAPRKAAPAPKAAASPARTTSPKTPPQRPPRRPTRG